MSVLSTSVLKKTTRLNSSIKISDIILLYFVNLNKLYNKCMHFSFDEASLSAVSVKDFKLLLKRFSC